MQPIPYRLSFGAGCFTTLASEFAIASPVIILLTKALPSTNHPSLTKSRRATVGGAVSPESLFDRISDGHRAVGPLP